MTISTCCFALFGCSSSDTTTMTAAPTVDWADSVCTSVVTYEAALKAAGTTLRSEGLSQAAVENAAATMRGATDDLVAALSKVGPPNTAGGATVSKTLDTLGQQLQADAKKITDAAANAKPADAVAVASATLATAKDQIDSATETIKGADTDLELESAFSDAPACVALR